MQRLHKYTINVLLLSTALLVAIHPAMWLINSWLDVSYASNGVWVAFLVLALFLFSVTSQLKHASLPEFSPLVLLAISAIVRLTSQYLGVNVIGALTLVVDVYAIGKWLGLDKRVRAVSPAWLSFLFLLALPLERVLQRSVGFGLQQLSASGACELLKVGSDTVTCNGVRILIAQKDVLVDLPCSGARVLIILLVAFAMMGTLARPSLRGTISGLGITLLSALTSNVIRISIMALGIAHPEYIANIDVMAAPWHELIGLVTVVLGLAPLLMWWHFCTRSQHKVASRFQRGLLRRNYSLKLQYAGTFALLVVSITAIALKPQPIDVAKGVEKPSLPMWLNGQIGTALALGERESVYFEQYGGYAARARYGENTLTLVRTSAPLRHLHAPDECLRGSGHEVRYLGIVRNIIPTAIYRSTDPDGRQWRVAVTFVSNQGEVTTNVAHAVWLWFKRPHSHWTMVQRVTPWVPDSLSAHSFDSEIARAFDIPHPERDAMQVFVQSMTQVGV